MIRVLTNPDDWDKCLDDIGEASVYATRRYVSALANQEPGSSAEAVCYTSTAGTVFHPYLRRPIATGSSESDLISSFDFGGFWTYPTGPDSLPGLAAEFGNEYASWCSDQGIVCEFIRIQPFTDHQFVESAGYELSFVSDNVVVDLDVDQGVRWSNYSATLRTTIGRGRRRGLTCNRVDTLSGFMPVFEASLDRLSATEYYRAPEQVFIDATNKWVIFEARTADDEIAAAHLYLSDNDVLWAYQCHNNPQFLAERPSDCLYNFVIDWAASHGYKWLHLGGGSRSLLEYKSKYSDVTVPYFVARQVMDQSRYDSLVATSGVAGDTEYFPAYRESAHRDNTLEQSGERK